MFTWALIGSPNSGKTTLYNWLTGAKSKTVNYPGATIEYSIGSLRSALQDKVNVNTLSIVDTPGIYSFNPRSEDEVVTYKTLFSKEKKVNIDAVIVVLDATQLSRHLVILEQIKNSGYPIIAVVTMRDMLEKQNIKLNLEVLKKQYPVEFILFDGIMGQGLNELLAQMNKMSVANADLKTQAPEMWTIQQTEETLKLAHDISEQALGEPNKVQQIFKTTDFVDKYTLHPFFGFIIFFVVMTVLFSSIYWMSKPLMDLIEAGFGFTTETITKLLPGLVGDFLGNGLLAAIGGVAVFIPQIFILFVGIGILESTGYLARVAALIDKPLSMVGLGGRSFVPLLSGFACAIPAIMATRNITSKKEKLIAQSIIPFLTCSARLPVFGLFIGFLFGGESSLKAGFVMASAYLGSLVVGIVAAKLLSKVLKGEKNTRLMMELPPYRQPKYFKILLQSFDKAKAFLFRAGPIILVLSLVLWFGTTFPQAPEGSEVSASEVASHSYAAQLGHKMEPIFKPLGVDWRVGFGLISAFAAREVFVSSLALVFNIDGDEDQQAQGLLHAMREAKFEDGTPIFTVATITGLFIFFIIALQCVTTVGILKKESGSWRPALLQLVLSNLLAYSLAAVVVNVLKAFGL